MTKLAIYAGTFDPLTLGHLDLIERSSEIFGEVILAVATAVHKQPLFTLEERIEMAEQVVAVLGNVRVAPFSGLLIDYARKHNARILIRGLRAYSDFEYEFQMALTNRKLAPEIETLFMMPKEIHSYVSSSTVREVSRLGGNTSEFVPPAVQRRIEAKVAGLADKTGAQGCGGER
jgi:pantetheine-phosphate adenylyltransferase